MAAQIPTLGHQASGPQPQRRAVDLRIPAIEKYAYCLCLHVKPTTIFIAVFKLIRSLLSATILLNTEASLTERPNGLGITQTLDDRHRSTAAAMNIFTRVIIASASAVGIYGVVSGRAALLMPLYAMLLTDFFFALPALYNFDLDASFSDSWPPADLSRNHYQPGITEANYPHYNRFTTIMLPTFNMLVRIYFLCVVWKCYRYLRLIELITPIRLSEIYPHIPPVGPQYPIVRVLGSIDSTDLSSVQNVTPPPYDSVASSLKPPNYEEAMKSSGSLGINNCFQEPPPPPPPPSQNPAQHSSVDADQLNRQAQQTVVFTIPTTDSEVQQSVTTQVFDQTTDLPQSSQAPENSSSPASRIR